MRGEKRGAEGKEDEIGIRGQMLRQDSSALPQNDKRADSPNGIRGKTYKENDKKMLNSCGLSTFLYKGIIKYASYLILQ